MYISLCVIYCIFISHGTDNSLTTQSRVVCIARFVFIQLPVIAVDSYCPVISPFTGNEQGNLAVLLAMGSAQQVAIG